MRARCAAVTAVLAFASTSASAQSVHLSLTEALSRARDQSPVVLAALARIDESRSRVIGAGLRFRENPVLDVSSGPRFGDGRTTIDLDVGFRQPFETGGQRSARVAGAEAGVAAAVADAESTRRDVLAQVGTSYYRLAHAEAIAGLLAAAEQTADEVLRIATRRFDAGDVAALDVNLARTARARARSTRIAADAERRLNSAELARLVGLGPDVDVQTDDGLASDRAADLNRLLAALDTRSDLRALTAGIAEANADVRLGLAGRKPDLSLEARVKKEGTDHAVLGGLTISLPTSNSGQELRAAGAARSERLRRELDASRAIATSEVRALYDAYATRRAAAAAFEQDALAAVQENEQLAQRSYEEGEISLADLLVVRREVIETRLEYLDRLLDAATTAVARDSAAGVLQ